MKLNAGKSTASPPVTVTPARSERAALKAGAGSADTVTGCRVFPLEQSAGHIEALQVNGIRDRKDGIPARTERATLKHVAQVPSLSACRNGWATPVPARTERATLKRVSHEWSEMAGIIVPALTRRAALKRGYERTVHGACPSQIPTVVGPHWKKADDNAGYHRRTRTPASLPGGPH